MVLKGNRAPGCPSRDRALRFGDRGHRPVPVAGRSAGMPVMTSLNAASIPTGMETLPGQTVSVVTFSDTSAS